MHFMRSAAADVKRDPVRALLTIMGIGVGVAIVTLTVNVSNALVAANRAGFTTPGVRMIVATATRDGVDGLRYVEDILALSDREAIRRLVPSVKAITPVIGKLVTPESGVDFGTIQVGDFRYQTRSVLAVGSEYPAVYDLDMVAGSFFTQGDVDGGRRVVVISESTADRLFGSAAAALGAVIGAAEMPDRRRVDYTVVGVFDDPAPVTRDSYDIADLLVPLLLPPRYLDAFAVLVDEPSADVAAAKLAAAARSLHGPDTPALAWEGNRWSYGSPDARQSGEISTVVLFLDAFGALALIIASTGILTMMMVSVVERSRSIGLRRALGSSRAGVALSFMGEAVLLAGAGSLLGVASAALAAGPALASLAPILPGFEDGVSLSARLRLDSIAVGIMSALAAGALFSLPPAVLASRVQPAESMRDA